MTKLYKSLSLLINWHFLKVPKQTASQKELKHCQGRMWLPRLNLNRITQFREQCLARSIALIQDHQHLLCRRKTYTIMRFCQCIHLLAECFSTYISAADCGPRQWTHWYNELKHAPQNTLFKHSRKCLTRRKTALSQQHAQVSGTGATSLAAAASWAGQ